MAINQYTIFVNIIQMLPLHVEAMISQGIERLYLSCNDPTSRSWNMKCSSLSDRSLTNQLPHHNRLRRIHFWDTSMLALIWQAFWFDGIDWIEEGIPLTTGRWRRSGLGNGWRDRSSFS